MILIGSRAMKLHYPDFNREPFDTDLLVKEIPDKKEPMTEYHIIPPLMNKFKNIHLVFPTVEKWKPEALSRYDLMLLKLSHIFWDIKWEKHMFDIQFMIKKNPPNTYNGRTTEDDIETIMSDPLFNDLYKFWEAKHGKNIKSDLTMDGKDFFNNALKKYDHDYLHTLINPNPTYKIVLKDNKSVEPDEEKFHQLAHEQKLDLVREEIYVMAYERLAGRDYRTAYSWMLKKFIMNHAPKFEIPFIIANYIELHKPIINYKQKLDLCLR